MASTRQDLPGGEKLQVEHHLLAAAAGDAALDDSAVSCTVIDTRLRAASVFGLEVHPVLIGIAVRPIRRRAVLLDLIPIGNLVGIEILGRGIIMRDSRRLAFEREGHLRFGDAGRRFLPRAIDHPLAKFKPIDLGRRVWRGDTAPDGKIGVAGQHARRLARFGVADVIRIESQGHLLAAAARDATLHHGTIRRTVGNARLGAAEIFLEEGAAVLVGIAARIDVRRSILIEFEPVGNTVRVEVLGGRKIFRHRVRRALDGKIGLRERDAAGAFLPHPVHFPLGEAVTEMLRTEIHRGHARALFEVFVARDDTGRGRGFGVSIPITPHHHSHLFPAAARNTSFDYPAIRCAVRDARLRTLHVFVNQSDTVFIGIALGPLAQIAVIHILIPVGNPVRIGVGRLEDIGRHGLRVLEDFEGEGTD